MMLPGEVEPIVSAAASTYIRFASILGKRYGTYGESPVSRPESAEYRLHISNTGRLNGIDLPRPVQFTLISEKTTSAFA
jgi:hypothetical protein